MSRATWFGFDPPFLDGDIVMPLQLDERLIKNDLLQLLMTSPGERVMRPDFGTPIRTAVLEEQNDFVLESNLRSSIISQMSKYENRVTVADIQIERSEHTVIIKLFGSINVKNNPKTDFDIELKLPTSVTQ